MFSDSARSVISAASTASTSTAPPSSISLTSSAVSTALSLEEICPDCEECASSAMTANFRPFSDESARISSSANGKVCTVTAMMSSPFLSAVASSPDFDFAPALRTSSGLIVATIFPDPSICRIASWSCPSSTVRSTTTMTESKTFSSFTCSRASRCAVQAMVFVFPEPAECSIR